MAYELNNGTATITALATPEDIDTVTDAGSITLSVDMKNLIDNEQFEIVVYGKSRAGETEQKIVSYGFFGIQGSPVKNFGPFENTNHLKFTIEQINGTKRAYTWSVMQAR